MIYKRTYSFGDFIVFMNGRALYKRWPDGSSMIFESYGPNTTNRDRDRGRYQDG